METRVAIIGIVIENTDSALWVNNVLHEYADFIIGRMGLPYKKRGINIISIAIDAPSDTINTICGKIGKIEGVTSKAVFSKQ